MKPYIRNNCFWIPVKEIRKPLVKKYFQVSLGTTKVENQYYEEEVEEILKIYKTKRHSGTRWIGFPIGRPSLIAKCLTDRGLRNFEKALSRNDKRVQPRGRYKIKFTAQPYDYQSEAVSALKKHGRGVLKSPPRSGKCVAGDTYVFTKEHGLTKISSIIEAGQQDGVPHELRKPTYTKTDSGSHAVKMSFYKRNAEVYQIKCASGRTLTCTPEHPMQVFNPYTCDYEWVRTDELHRGAYLPVDLHYNKRVMPSRDKYMKVPKGTLSQFPTRCTPELAELLALFSLTTEVKPHTDNHDRKLVSIALWSIHERPSAFSNAGGKSIQHRITYLLRKLFMIDHWFTGDVIALNPHVYSYLNYLGAFNVETVPSCILSAHEYPQVVYLRTWLKVHSIYCQLSAGDYDHIEFGDNPKRLSVIQTWLTNFGVNSMVTPKVTDVLPSGELFTAGTSMKIRTNSLHHAKKTLGLEVNWNSYFSPHLNFALESYHNEKSHPHDEVVVPGSLKLFKESRSCNSWWMTLILKSTDDYTRERDFTRGELRSRLEHIRNEVLRSKFNAVINDQCYYDYVVSVEKLEKTQTVYDIEVEEVHNFIANGFRAHNTVMSTKLICDLNYKTLVLAHQSDLLDQFLGTFKKMTNYQELEKRHGTSLVGICNTMEDYHKYQICLSTYQGFLDNNNGREKLKEIKDLFGLIIVDECHRAPADGYSNVLLALNAMFMLGLSGTPDRKDGKYIVADRIFGKIVHECEVDTLRPNLSMTFTNVEKKAYKVWTRAMAFLASHEKRNKHIVKQAIKDIEAGHSVLIPVTLTAHADELVRLINKNWEKRHGRGNKIALAYTGRIHKSKREQLLDTLRNGDFRCCVAMRSMLTGINVPLWSAIYTVIPISNEPNYTQEVTRVLTPLDGKKTPVIRFFLDENWGMCVSCFATCWKTLKGYSIEKNSKSLFSQAFALLKAKSGGLEDPYDDDNKPRKSVNTQPTRQAAPFKF